MHARTFMHRSGFDRNAFLKVCLCGLILVGAMSNAVQAQGIIAGAQMSGVALGGGEYAYTLTLTNSAASIAGIQMFWFAWDSGQADFLASVPTSIKTPAGWNSLVDGGGANDGYSIQFVTFTTPLVPGSSMTFTFNSPDSPALMAGPAPLFPQNPTLSSQVYSGHSADGLQDVFVAQLVPGTADQTNNLPAKNVVSLRVARATPTIAFSGVPGGSYVVQSALNPNGPWIDLSPAITARTNGLVQYTDMTRPLSPMRFYRTRSAQ